MRRIVYLLSVFLLAGALEAQITVTVDSSLKWSNVSGASSYQAGFRSATGGPFLPVTLDPSTNDPDGDGLVNIPEHPSGETSVPLAYWLTSRPTANYQFELRSVDSNGNAGPFLTPVTIVTYAAPPPPNDVQLAMLFLGEPQGVQVAATDCMLGSGIM